MSVTLQEITRIDKVQGGIQSVSITAEENITTGADGFTVADDDEVYSVFFRRGSAAYEEELKTARAGDYVDQSLSFFVPGKRLDVEYVINQLMNKRLVVIFHDNDGTGGMLLAARLRYKYQTGRKRSENNGYDFTFTTQSLRKSLDYSGVGIDLPTGGDPGYSDPGGSSSDCCVVINPTPLASTPSVSGNTENLNSFVIDPDGQTWFIDHEGRGLKFPTYPEYYEQLTPDGTDEIEVTVATLPLINTEQKINLTHNGVRLHYSGATASDAQHYGIDSGTNKLQFFENVQSWEEVRIYFNS